MIRSLGGDWEGRVMAQQKPSFRLPEAVLDILEHVADQMEQQFHKRPKVSHFCHAALVDFLSLDLRTQLDRIYDRERNLDTLKLRTSLEQGLARTETEYQVPHAVLGRKAVGSNESE